MNQYKKFKDWLTIREDSMAINSDEKKTNDLVAAAAAAYARKMNLVPGAFQMNQLHKALNDPQIKSLGANAGKAIEILKGSDSLEKMKKPGNQ